MAKAAKAAPARHGPRKKVWQEVEEQEARRLSNRARQANRKRRQLAVVYDIDGPKVRIGVAWFVLVCVAYAFGPVALAAVYALIAALGGAQVARAWQRRASDPNVAAAATIAAALPLAAAVSTAALGVAVLASVVVAGVAAMSSSAPLLSTARTLQCSLWIGGGAAGLAAVTRFVPPAGLALILVVSAYEMGDFLVGTGARNAIEGPVAGAAAALVVQFTVSFSGLLEPFTISNGLTFAALAAVLCPAGQLAASLVLPSVRAKAPALRRLDSLLLLGPAWALLAGQAALQQALAGT